MLLFKKIIVVLKRPLLSMYGIKLP